jgi:predicted DNA-binding transcriptional regulator AlpA
MHPHEFDQNRNASLSGPVREDNDDQSKPGLAGVTATPRAPPTMDGFISPRECRAITSLSRTSIWRLEHAGKFPLRRRLSTQRVAYLRSEILEWVASREVV